MYIFKYSVLSPWPDKYSKSERENYTLSFLFSKTPSLSCSLAPAGLQIILKDGACYCYCAYILRISRYSDFLSPMLTNTGIFLRGLKLSGESTVDLSKYSWYPKRKLGVTMHFGEIIKLQFEKECHTYTLLCILKLFTDIIHELSLENAWLPPIFFLDFNRIC